MRQVDVEQLSLFDTGPNMAEIRSTLRDFKACTTAKSTVHAYDSDWRDFERWCVTTGRAALPASGETVALYVAARLASPGERQKKSCGAPRRHSDRLSVSTVQRHVAAIAFRHKAAGFPIFDRSECRAAINGARRQRKESPRQRQAISPVQLRKMCDRLFKETTAEAARDRAVLTLGFATGLRRSNLAALNVSDIEFARKGMIVTVRSSKTDQLAKGQHLRVFRGVRVATCPVRALKQWLAFRGDDSGPLFTTVVGGDRVRSFRLRGYDINQIVKDGLVSIGVKDTSNYGAHSLRAGFVTTAHTEGASPLAIMEYTGHHTVEMVAKYLRPVEVFPARSPLGRAV